MARRGKKGKRGKTNKAIPLLAFAPAVPAAVRIAREGINATTPDIALFELTGYSASTGTLNTGNAKRQVVLALVGIVGHKLANKSGLNRAMKKMTMGYFQF